MTCTLTASSFWGKRGMEDVYDENAVAGVPVPTLEF